MYARHQAALRDLSEAALLPADLSQFMCHVVACVADTLDVRYSRIMELLPDGGRLVLRAGFGAKPGSLEQETMDEAISCPANCTLPHNTPVIAKDGLSETQFGHAKLLHEQGVVYSLWAAIGRSDHPFGILCADSDVPRTFADAEIHFLQTAANVLAMAVERVQAHQTLEQRVAERIREIEWRHQVADSLPAILTILNSNGTLDDILDYIVRQACRLLGANAAAIYRVHSQEAMLDIHAAYGLDTEYAVLNLPSDWGAAGQAVLTQQPVVVTDGPVTLPAHSPGLGVPQTPPLLVSLANRYRSLLAVPLIIKADVYGVITLYYQAPRQFSDEDIRLAVALSAQSALAIENARLIVAAQGQAVREERQRLARDLHDSVTQALYGVTLHAEAATRLLSAGDVATAAHVVGELQDIAQDAFEEMRLLIFELRPPVLDQEGLVAALRARLDCVEGRTSLQTELVVEGVSLLPTRVEQALYRIAQESLNNALRHAHAHHITVSLQQEQHSVVLEITDDGDGFDPARAREKGGLGLRGMEERAAEVGGRLDLYTAPGAGTSVRVEVVL
ncbi:MAG TPA: GAF domain-containing protein [Herpetosiphonaceae bacterium]|nr:GAF domain-containing protein [Herpetosiphonaceae bacterium]